jgi:hypothetical protein
VTATIATTHPRLQVTSHHTNTFQPHIRPNVYHFETTGYPLLTDNQDPQPHVDTHPLLVCKVLNSKTVGRHTHWACWQMYTSRLCWIRSCWIIIALQHSTATRPTAASTLPPLPAPVDRMLSLDATGLRSTAAAAALVSSAINLCQPPLHRATAVGVPPPHPLSEH